MGGAIHINIKYFNLIWERMINKYLNEYFERVDNRKLIFNKDKIHNIEFEQKEIPIGQRGKKEISIKPDFYFEDENSIYVFDAKYYKDLSNIEYKQVAYTLLLGNSQLNRQKDIYSALFLPGTEPNGLHVLLSKEFEQMKEGCNYIIEQYMDVKMLMKNYIES